MSIPASLPLSHEAIISDYALRTNTELEDRTNNHSFIVLLKPTFFILGYLAPLSSTLHVILESSFLID